MNIADATGNRWITAFNEDAEKILGMSAQELGELKENDNDSYMQKFGNASFKRFTFGIRVKSEVFQVTDSLLYISLSLRELFVYNSRFSLGLFRNKYKLIIFSVKSMSYLSSY